MHLNDKIKKANIYERVGRVTKEIYTFGSFLDTFITHKSFQF